jgi:hypothetical protein
MNFALGLLDDFERHGDLHVDQFSGFMQPLGVLTGFEDDPAISALALEYLRRVMERVGEDVNLGLAPGHHFAIHPDIAVAVVQGLSEGAGPLKILGFPCIYSLFTLASIPSRLIQENHRVCKHFHEFRSEYNA